jgi:Family of unknown function (DUF5719)
VVRRLLANKYLLALLVVMALAAVYGLASLSHPGAVTATIASSKVRATVSTATRACPGPGSADPATASIALAASSSGTGRAEVSRLTPTGSTTPAAALQVLTQPGRLALVSVPAAPVPAPGLAHAPAGSTVPTVAARGGVMIQATGSMARGLEAEQAGAGGLATAQCQAPGTDFWFVGPGQTSAAAIQLYLMNTDSQTADVTVDIFTDSGPILGSTDAGISVPPHSQVMQSLAGTVNGSHALAMNVTTSVGTVVAAVQETSPGQPGAWLPATQAPATTMVLPGLPGTPGGGQLYIAVPGANNAQVTVTAITARGSYHPTGGTGINLPGGSAGSVPLSSLAGIPAALKITSNVPVTASMSVPGGQPGAPGVLTVAGGPVLEQGVIAGNPGGGGGSSSVVLSAPAAAAKVRVTELSATGQAAAPSQLVQVPAKHTVVTALPAGGSAFAVVITPLPRSGPVYAGRVVTQNDSPVSLIPVTSALTWVPLAAVSSSLGAALP